MKLTTKSEYSILALLYLARRQNGSFVKIEQLCIDCRIPKKYLQLLFGTLRQNRLIKTRRGTAGGYRLAKPAAQITLASVIRLLDGPLAPTESVSRYFHTDTPISKEPKMMAVMQDIRNYISDKLENLTLADLT